MATRSTHQLIAAAAALATVLPACSVRRESGRPPEGPIREVPTDRAGQLDRAGAYARRSEQAPGTAGRQETPDPSAAVVGVAATRAYHRPDCGLLDGVPDAGRVRFTSAWEGLDARYRPCADCRPGP